MTKEEWLSRTIDSLKFAIKNFGEYTFFDKGPREVMDVRAISKYLSTLSPEDAGGYLERLYHSNPRDEIVNDGHCKTLANDLICNLDHMPDEWWNIMCNYSPSVVY
jgi:hypothetical protein